MKIKDREHVLKTACLDVEIYLEKLYQLLKSEGLCTKSWRVDADTQSLVRALKMISEQKDE